MSTEEGARGMLRQRTSSWSTPAGQAWRRPDPGTWGMGRDGRERVPRTLNRADRRALGLGWFSLGLGIAQIAAPGRLARVIGAGGDERKRTTMLAVGAREILSGVGIL